MISAVDLLKGIAVGAGMDNIVVEGANGGLHTNYEGKARAAVKALTEGGYDFAYIHVEAPDEMGHQGSVERKIQAIENLDQRVIRLVREGMDASGEAYRLMVLPTIRRRSVSELIPAIRFPIFCMTALRPEITTGIIMRRKLQGAEMCLKRDGT